MVPKVGMWNNLPHSTFDVPEKPPRKEYWEAVKPPSGPCALLMPNYMHYLPFAAVTIRLALVLTRVANPIKFNRGVSSIWQKANGPVRVMIGSLANTISPSLKLSMIS